MILGRCRSSDLRNPTQNGGDFPKQKNVPTGRLHNRPVRKTVKKSAEGFDGGFLVVLDVENRVQLGNLKQVVDLLGQV